MDDRFIHGQVIEGWINYYHIPNIIIVNDSIASDLKRKIVFESVMPVGSRLVVMSLKEFNVLNLQDFFNKGDLLVIVGSIKDLFALKQFIDKNTYVNIGCLAAHMDSFQVTDSVFINDEEFNILNTMSSLSDILVHKVPWEKPLNIRDFIKDKSGDS